MGGQGRRGKGNKVKSRKHPGFRTHKANAVLLTVASAMADQGQIDDENTSWHTWWCSESRSGPAVLPPLREPWLVGEWPSGESQPVPGHRHHLPSPDQPGSINDGSLLPTAHSCCCFHRWHHRCDTLSVRFRDFLVLPSLFLILNNGYGGTEHRRDAVIFSGDHITKLQCQLRHQINHNNSKMMFRVMARRYIFEILTTCSWLIGPYLLCSGINIREYTSQYR